MNDIILAVLGSSVVATIVSQVIEAVKERNRRNISNAEEIDAIRDGVRCVLMDRLHYLATVYIRDGEVGEWERRHLNEMYETGHELGLNGDLKNIMERFNALPIKK